MDSSCWVPLRPLAVSQQAWHCTFGYIHAGGGTWGLSALVQSTALSSCHAEGS